MVDIIEVVFWSTAVGVGATVILDLWIALFAKLGMPGPDWAMVGRWVGHMPKGRFVNDDIKRVEPIKGELALGWLVHYGTGIAYGLILVAIQGRGWLEEPTIMPALILLWVSLIAPYFLMMPGLGEGIAASKTKRPNFERMQSVVGHSIFAIGMFLSAWAIRSLFG
ncbi:DUF2938 domain-containing protein [Marinobacter hydrocarbonoclasticus]|uniref:DUF2938 domain-containing protein n=1 Tax=Marinobacter nauticus TaxID=2743 RepID=UPI001C93995D|nr:DUF2938 domain-containing protein [Marinobacter nauticus]MBY6193736.1 DUF2938 domain-containing protein [Marinobacter nauticus]MBY6214884.1 DUF2938 domain-containing protein [Marinobacter nauticus]